MRTITVSMLWLVLVGGCATLPEDAGPDDDENAVCQSTYLEWPWLVAVPEAPHLDEVRAVLDLPRATKLVWDDGTMTQAFLDITFDEAGLWHYAPAALCSEHQQDQLSLHVTFSLTTPEGLIVEGLSGYMSGWNLDPVSELEYWAFGEVSLREVEGPYTPRMDPTGWDDHRLVLHLNDDSLWQGGELHEKVVDVATSHGEQDEYELAVVAVFE